MSRRLLLLLTLSLGVCAVGHAQQNRAVLFVPGLYGSVLEDASDETYWVSPAKLLFNGPSIQICHDFLVGPCPELKAGGLLRGISVIPLLYSIDAYGETADNLRDIVGKSAHFSVFSYDWRQDLTELAEQLSRRINSLGEKYEKVDVIAHSMGGLILSYYLVCQSQDLQGCQPDVRRSKVHRSVIVGTPFRGSATTFVNMVNGRDFAGNTTMMTARAYGSFPSIFQLLPMDQGKILDEQLQPIDAAVGSADSWVRGRWGIFSEPSKIASPEGAKIFVERNLRRAKSFQSLLDSESGTSDSNRQLLLVQGQGHSTLDTVVYRETNGQSQIIKSRKEWPEDLPGKGEKLFADGDGTVVMNSSAAPRILERQMSVIRKTTDFEHGAMFKDPKILAAIAQFLKFEKKD